MTISTGTKRYVLDLLKRELGDAKELHQHFHRVDSSKYFLSRAADKLAVVTTALAEISTLETTP